MSRVETVACDAVRRVDGVVSLPVVEGPTSARRVRKSRMGPRRAAALIGVHLIFAVHIALWWVYGMTLSPVEPSESMYTLEQGLVNAGFVFFLLAILSTLIFGRFFCGWGCHVVALQDLCGWAMKRMGVHPKPFRSRLLVYAPLGLAIYMFVWPTFKREVVKPLAGSHWETVAPYLGDVGPRPEFKAAFVKEDFWETFAPWHIAIPFLAVCGFATVYFLGAKGFCTYGCPYGGFFAPLDRLSPGRIIVSNACHHCGHCTAVCTSNVRVHEEVRDYGMVVDPGCMKCMDCVSVCPNGALSFGFGTPPVLARPRDAAARERVKVRRERVHAYDLTRREEWGVAAAFVALLFAFRGMLGAVPLLMAAGMAAIGAFAAWKLRRLAVTPNVRLSHLQLAHRGRLTRAGRIFIAAAAVYLGAGAWSGAVRLCRWRAETLDAMVPTPLAAVLAGEVAPTPDEKARATAAITWLSRSAPPSEGGFGWDLSALNHMRLARLHGLLGGRALMEHHLTRAVMLAQPEPGHLDAVGQVMALRGATIDEIGSMYADAAEAHQRFAFARVRVAQFALRAGRLDEGVGMIRAVLDRADLDATTLIEAANTLLHAGHGEEALAAARRACEADPRAPRPRAAAGGVLSALGRHAEAIEEMEQAVALDHGHPNARLALARLLRAAGREEEAAAQERAAAALMQGPAGR